MLSDLFLGEDKDWFEFFAFCFKLLSLILLYAYKNPPQVAMQTPHTPSVVNAASNKKKPRTVIGTLFRLPKIA